MLHYAARIGCALPFAVTEPVPSRPPRNGGKQLLIWAIKIGVSGGLLYLLLSRVDLGRLWLVARTASLPCGKQSVVAAGQGRHGQGGAELDR